MTKFFARFDAKAAKGNGKVNPPASLSQGRTAAVMGGNPGAGVVAASPAHGSPLAGKTPVVSGSHVGEGTHQSKRARVSQGKIFFLIFSISLPFRALLPFVLTLRFFLGCYVQLDLQ
jgi:hypothetical protein